MLQHSLRLKMAQSAAIDAEIASIDRRLTSSPPERLRALAEMLRVNRRCGCSETEIYADVLCAQLLARICGNGDVARMQPRSRAADARRSRPACAASSAFGTLIAGRTPARPAQSVSGPCSDRRPLCPFESSVAGGRRGRAAGLPGSLLVGRRRDAVTELLAARRAGTPKLSCGRTGPRAAQEGSGSGLRRTCRRRPRAFRQRRRRRRRRRARRPRRCPRTVGPSTAAGPAWQQRDAAAAEKEARGGALACDSLGLGRGGSRCPWPRAGMAERAGRGAARRARAAVDPRPRIPWRA